VIEGQLSNQAAVQRTKDIHEVISSPDCSGMKIVAEQTATWDRTQAQNLMTNWLSKGSSSTRWFRTTTKWRSAPFRR
jgi:inositol transport system substrate-binding protein